MEQSPGSRERNATWRPKATTRKIAISCMLSVAMIFSVLAASDCRFISGGSSDRTVELGLFSRAFYDSHQSVLGCVKYTEETHLDGMFKAARAFAALAALATSYAWLAVATVVLALPRGIAQNLWNSSRYILASATICQMFTFFVVGSDVCQSTTCSLSTAGVIALLNTMLLATLSALLFLEPIPDNPLFMLWSKGENDATQVTDNVESLGPCSGSGGIPAVAPRQVGNVPVNIEFLEMEVVTEQNQQPNGQTESDTHFLSSCRTAEGIQNRIDFRLLFSCILICGWIITIFGVQRCTFILVDVSESGSSDRLGIGLYSQAVYQQGNLLGCVAYPEDEKSKFDEAFQAGRAFGAIAAFLMTAVVLIVVVQMFSFVAKEEIWFIVRALLPCATVAQLFTFLAFKSEACSAAENAECRPGGVGIMVIMNVFILVSLSCTTFLVPPALHPIFALWGQKTANRRSKSEKRTLDAESCDEHSHGNKTEGSTEHEDDPELIKPSDIFNTKKEIYTRCQSHLQKTHPSTSRQLMATPWNQSRPMYSTRLTSTPAQQAIPVKLEQDLTPQADSISIRVEYAGSVRKTIKTISHIDGSITITTTIEELEDQESVESDGTDCELETDECTVITKNTGTK